MPRRRHMPPILSALEFRRHNDAYSERVGASMTQVPLFTLSALEALPNSKGGTLLAEERSAFRLTYPRLLSRPARDVVHCIIAETSDIAPKGFCDDLRN